MKDKRNCHGAVGKSSSEQHFRKSAAIEISGALHLAQPGLTAGLQAGRLAGRQAAGWQADKIQVNFEIFKSRNIQLVASFNQGTASLQPYQCIQAGFFG